MPRVTVVLPVYNHERYVEEAICSLYAQDYDDFEIAAVDDGSTDDSLRILMRHRPRIRVIEAKHQGPASARNIAIGVTDSEFIAFMDADDRCTPERLRVQVERLDRRDADLVASDMTFIDACGGTLPGMWTCPADASRDYWGSLLERNWIGTPAVMIRRSVLDSSGPFDDSFTHAEDYDLWLRIGRHHPLAHMRSALVHCRRHVANTSMCIRSHQHFEQLALGKIEPEQARLAFHRLYTSEQRRAEAWVSFLLRRGDPAFREEAHCALRLHPCSQAIRFALGVSQYESGEYDSALGTFEPLKDSDVSALHNLAVVYAQQGNTAAAESHLQAALQLNSGYFDAQYNIAALRNGQELRLTRRPLRQHPVPMIGEG